MKAFFSILALILVIGAAALLYSNQTGGSPVSESSQAVSLCEEGTADLNAFRLNDAREKLQASLELDPDLAEASISLAFTYWRLGRVDEFKATIARSDSLVANIADPDRRMMAQLRLSSSDVSRFTSIRDSLLTRLQAEKPDNIHVLVAVATHSKHSDKDAEKAWLRVIEVDPNYAVSYNMLGYMELNRGNYDQAIEHMQKYAFLAPDLANPHDSLGDVYFAQGRYEDAEAEYVKSVTMQPDFYVSLINLGRTYLARGQINKGVDILEKVRSQVSGSRLEQKVDQDILNTLIVYRLDEELDKMSAKFVSKWPEEGAAAFFRAMRLAHMDQLPQSQAVMDSALTTWRLSDYYKISEEYRKEIDSAGKSYQALVSDLVDPPATRVRHWASLVAMNAEDAPHEQWYGRWRLGKALLENNQPTQAMEQIAPMLEINPRLITPLLLAVQIKLAQSDYQGARGALEQAKWALSQADADFPPLAEAAALEKKIDELDPSS